MPEEKCPKCDQPYLDHIQKGCPCEPTDPAGKGNFRNSDDYLKSRVPEVLEERKNLGLEDMVDGLEAVIINVEIANHDNAVNDYLKFTGHKFISSFQDAYFISTVLGNVENSADLIIQSRLSGKNPFSSINLHPKSSAKPNTRLETFIFSVKDIDKYYEIQSSRGIQFLGELVHNDSYSYAQVTPSKYTGNSIGLIQWHGPRNFSTDSVDILPEVEKPDLPHLKNIGRLDHVATRVHAQDRDRAILEFMELTNYKFDFAIYVKSMNSITNVARLSKGEYAMVFTSGISPYKGDGSSGPTERFIHNYGTRAHHMAFETQKIEDIFNDLKETGMGFLIDLVGSPDEGLKQTFSNPSESTFLVNEYIHRYNDFDGFFTRSNVTLLTEATDKQ